MEYEYAELNEYKEKYKKTEYFIRLMVYGLVSFFVPFFIGHPQVIVGTVVNMLLFMSAKKMDVKGALPAILFPSIGVLTRGLIFGPFTVFLIYLIPIIWLGNSVLVFGMSYLNKKRSMNYFASSAISIAAKVILLFGSAYLMNQAGLIPAALVSAMGAMQILTAVLGGILAYGAFKLKN